MGDIEAGLHLVSTLLEVTPEEVSQRPLEGDDATYFWTEGRGGSAIIVAGDGTLLFANSSVDPQQHLRAFREGRRTPLEQFGA